MPDPFAPEGILPNVLRWIDRPGQAVRNVLRGNPAAAGRQVLDFLTEPVDAAIPFWDAIPEATTRPDYVSGSELVGIDQNNAIGRTAADIGVGIATDPLTYLSFGMVPVAKGLANAGKYTIEAGIPFTSGAGRKALGYFDQAVDPLSLITRGADTGIKKGIGAVDKLTNTGTVAGKQSSNLQAYEGLKAGMRRAVGAEDVLRYNSLACRAKPIFPRREIVAANELDHAHRTTLDHPPRHRLPALKNCPDHTT